MADTSRLETKTPEQNMQEFAETAMKEMLSWYGYDRRESPPPPRSRHASSTSPETGADLAPDAEEPAAGSRHSPTLRLGSPDSDGSNSPTPASPVSAALADGGTAKRTPVVCSWCNKLGAQLYTMGSKAFCSEPCFSQSRVANFRKTKLCDWCKNIRDSLNIEYVNGDQQLQFCSEGCLNAYKMNIFCKETEAHIQMLPQLRELVRRSSNDPLITPDMWLHSRNNAGDEEGSTIAPEQVAASSISTARGGAVIPPPASGNPSASDRRRMRRTARPALTYRSATRGVRARSNTMPVLELRERARRRPSAPARPAPLTTAVPASAAPAGVHTSVPPVTQATPTPTASLPNISANAWQRYQLLGVPPRLGVPGAPGMPGVAGIPGLPPVPTPLPLPRLPPMLPPVTVMVPVPMAVPVPVPIPIPLPESLCRDLISQSQQRRKSSTAGIPLSRQQASAVFMNQKDSSAVQSEEPQMSGRNPECPILKRELEKDSGSGSDVEGLDLTVRKRKTDHPRKIKMEHDDFD